MRVFLALLLSTALHAQPPASEPSFSESLDVRETQVEVVVTGRDGQPVPGLTREDFKVREDGKPAEVTQVSAAASQPLMIAVFFDDLSLGGTARANAIAGLRRFFASGLKPGDRVLLARWDGKLAVQGDPTGDAAALGAMLDRLGAALPVRGSAQERDAIQRAIQQAQPYDEERGNGMALIQAEASLGDLRNYSRARSDAARATLEALQQTFSLLAGQTERKALLYVGGGIPLRPGADLFAL
ncbi:MAG TPA: hypothetical protein VGM86_20800, partial [Thermoanaerobaculia bacterium]